MQNILQYVMWKYIGSRNLLFLLKGLIFVCVGPWLSSLGTAIHFVFYMNGASCQVNCMAVKHLLHSLKEACQIFLPSCFLILAVVLHFLHKLPSTLLAFSFSEFIYILTDSFLILAAGRGERGTLIVTFVLNASWAQGIQGCGKYGLCPWWFWMSLRSEGISAEGWITVKAA